MIRAGSSSDQMTSLTDVMATLAAVVGADLPQNAAEDSYNILPVLLGEQGEEPVRKYLIQQTNRVHNLSIRRGSWKLLDHQGSGGNRYEGNDLLQAYIITDTAPEAPGQLYNLDSDPGETENLYLKHPEIVTELKQKLEEYKANDRSAPSRE
jgi:arylsulfatase A-like enzyme